MVVLSAILDMPKVGIRLEIGLLDYVLFSFYAIYVGSPEVLVSVVLIEMQSYSQLEFRTGRPEIRCYTNNRKM